MDRTYKNGKTHDPLSIFWRALSTQNLPPWVDAKQLPLKLGAQLQLSQIHGATAGALLSKISERYE